MFLSPRFLLTWLFPFLWVWKTLLNCTLYLWMPLERNGAFRVMEATTALEQLPSAEMSENYKGRQGKGKEQEAEKVNRSLFSGPALVYKLFMTKILKVLQLIFHFFLHPATCVCHVYKMWGFALLWHGCGISEKQRPECAVTLSHSHMQSLT